jgi:hypothetical protein
MAAMPKIALLVDPVEGFNAAQAYRPSQRLYLIEAATGQAVYEMVPRLQNEGEVDEDSGDRVWQVDFSEFTRPGRYFIEDPDQRVRSLEFVIDDGRLFKQVLREALRVFYYQRCGIAKTGHMRDRACHLGPGQDIACVDYDGRLGTRDLRGGWHDAGDYNKYVGYAYPAVKSLLNTYLMNPRLWQEIDLGIPESSDGTPDILGEIKWGLDWLLRMQVQDPSDQRNDGGVLYLVGNDLLGGDFYQYNVGKPASEDDGRRVYLGVTGQSTAAGASLYAYGAYVFKQAGFIEYARDLEHAALAAWNWTANNPRQFDSHFKKKADLAASNGQLYGSSRVALLEAALYLHLLTGDPKFSEYGRREYLRALRDDKGQISRYLGPALLYYTFDPDADPGVARSIQNDYQVIWIDNKFYHSNREDPYLNPNYGGAWWGSHDTVCSLAYLVSYGEIWGHSRLPLARSMVAGSLGYLHGRNPMDLVYLTSMRELGAERFLERFYHGDSQIAQSPPPGFLPGGPNASIDNGRTILARQPPLKAFDPSMQVEPAYEYFEGQIALQARYVQLLAAAITLFESY